MAAPYRHTATHSGMRTALKPWSSIHDLCDWIEWLSVGRQLDRLCDGKRSAERLGWPLPSLAEKNLISKHGLMEKKNLNFDFFRFTLYSGSCRVLVPTLERC